MKMLCTIYRKTIRSNREVTSTLDLEVLKTRLQEDGKKRRAVEAVRAIMPMLSPFQRWPDIEALPVIRPSICVRRKRDGTLNSTYNGVVTLEVRGLQQTSEVEDVKARAANWPMTLAAITGCSGKSVKILVRGTLDDGTLPNNEDNIQRFHKRLYDTCVEVYGCVLGHKLAAREAIPQDGFRWTYDPAPYVNTAAQPVKVNRKDIMRSGEAEEAQEYGPKSIIPSDENYIFYRRRFSLAVSKAMEQFPDYSYELCEKLLDATALEAVRLGIPQEETVYQAIPNAYFSDLGSTKIRTIVESIYNENAQHPVRRHDHPMQELTMRLQMFIEQHYDLRFNELTNGVEWRRNHSASFTFRILDTRVMNTMIQECHEAGLEVFDRDMKRYLGSTRIRGYNAACTYLANVGGMWDGKIDYIGQLADRVPNKNPHWREWFHTWFLGMVAQWGGWDTLHANSVVPLLIGQQGCGKSTFGQIILPPELREVGYRELVDFSSKTEVERLLTNTLLINLDEFNQISENIQQGFLKNLIQKSSVKGRRPYSSVTVNLPRFASFIATTNMTDVLSDPSSSRRFIVADIREGQRIDFSGAFHYEQMYAQAVAELTAGRRSYFTAEEVAELEAVNAQYNQQRPEVLKFLSCFEPTTAPDGHTCAMKVSELVAEVRRETGFHYSDKAINYLGRWLTSEARSMRVRRTMHNGCPTYLVRRLKKGSAT